MWRILIIICTILFISCSKDETSDNLDGAYLRKVLSNIDEKFETQNLRKQFVDSIANDYKFKSQPNYSLKNLFVIANCYYNMNEVDSYIEFTEKILILSKAQNDTLSYAKATMYKADYFDLVNVPDSAFQHYYNAKKIYVELNQEQLIADVNTKMARLKILENDWGSAELYAQQALITYIKNKQLSKQASLYNILGFISTNQGLYDDAIRMFDRGLLILSGDVVMDNPFQKELLEYNLAHSYLLQLKYTKADSIFTKILKKPNLKNKSSYLYSGVLASVAKTKFQLSVPNYEISQMYDEAIHIHDSLNFLSHSIINRVNYSEYCLILKDTLKSVILAKEAYLMSQSYKDKTLQTLSLQQLILADPKNASNYSKEYIALNDSLQIAERQMQNKFARIEFETDQMRIERDNAIFDNSIFLTLFLIFSILITGVLYFAYKTTGWSQEREFKFRQKLDSEIFYLVSQQQQKVMEGRQYEKARISRELHDGVLNDLSFVRNSLAYVIGKGEFASTFNGFQKYLDRLQLIEREIHTISHDLKGKTIIHGHSFRKIVDELFEHQHKTSPIQWKFAHDETIRWKYVNPQLKINIYRILQELIQNVNRHSYAKYATVNILRKNDKIEITIFDDGRGFTSKNQSTGIGLNNMRERMLLNGGSISVESGYKLGVKIILEFPY